MPCRDLSRILIDPRYVAWFIIKQLRDLAQNSYNYNYDYAHITITAAFSCTLLRTPWHALLSLCSCAALGGGLRLSSRRYSIHMPLSISASASLTCMKRGEEGKGLSAKARYAGCSPQKMQTAEMKQQEGRIPALTIGRLFFNQHLGGEMAEVSAADQY